LPWYAALGVHGFFVLNGVLLGVLVLAGAALVAPRTGWRIGFGLAIGVHALSIGPVYLHWIDPFLTLSTFVALGVLAHGRGLVVASGAAFGALASYRFPYLAPAIVPLVLHLGAGRRRAAVRYVTAAAATGLALTAITVASTGQWSSYTGPRFYYPTTAPYEDAADPGIPFSRDGLLEAWRPPAATTVATGLAHFLVGRYGGIALSFPTFFACLLWCRRWDRERRLWLAAVGGFALLLELAIPHNRIGGQHAVGNRFFVLLPLALVFVDRIRRPRAGRLAASMALVLPVLPVVSAPVLHSLAPGRALLAWPRRLFPFEWPLAEHVSYPARFPGLYALTAHQSARDGTLETTAGRAAEFVLVRPRDVAPRLKLWSPTPTTARVTDGGSTRTLAVNPEPLEILLTRPMSVHRDEYGARGEVAVYRLAIESEAHDPVVPGIRIEPLS
jgi:hypothetical protein